MSQRHTMATAGTSSVRLQLILPELLTHMSTAIIANQISMYFCLWAILPYYKPELDLYGTEPAMLAAAARTMLWSLVPAVMMTLPALVEMQRGKIQKEKKLPWGAMAKALPNVAFNTSITIVVVAAYGLATSSEQVLHDLTTELPSMYVLGAQTGLSFICSEVAFFAVHKAMHENKYLYSRIHKQHHAFTSPVALVATYCHPLEHLSANLGAKGCGMVLLQLASTALGCPSIAMHPVAYLAWTLMMHVHGYAVHCGYWSEDHGFHDLHHEKFNVNFGITGTLDRLCGSHCLNQRKESLK